jgi:hypothetical protein
VDLLKFIVINHTANNIEHGCLAGNLFVMRIDIIGTQRGLILNVMVKAMLKLSSTTLRSLITGVPTSTFSTMGSIAIVFIAAQATGSLT